MNLCSFTFQLEIHFMKNYVVGMIVLSVWFAPKTGNAQEEVTITQGNQTLAGTLVVPAGKGPFPVALLIAGSGPTDRNGNNPMMMNNALKILADSLSKRGIASLRYDKRGIGASRQVNQREEDLDFSLGVQDAEAWMKFLKKDTRLGKLTVIGHSEGALVGLLASGYANQYVSLNGPGFAADELIRQQLTKQAPSLATLAEPILDSLKRGYSVTQVPPLLFSLFRPSVQPYMMSWFKHDPARLISQLIIPGLVIQGSHDIQVSTADADRLMQYNPTLQRVTVEGMNHILKLSPADRVQNVQTYSNPNLPIPTTLILPLARFIQTGYWNR